MALLSGHCLRIRPYSLKGFGPHSFALLAGTVVLSCSTGVAATVTFQFDGEVASLTSLGQGFPPHGPIAIGDTIKTQFSFEPSTGSRFYPQNAILRLEHPNLVLETSDFQIGVLNDVPGPVELTGRIADPDNTSIVDQGPGPHDGLNISCGNNLSPFCGLVPGRTDLYWRANIALMNENGLLNSSDLTADRSIWNKFTFREMSLSFIDADTLGEAYIGAYIGAFQLVPEPQSLYLLGAILTVLLGVCRHRHTKVFSRDRTRL